MTEKVKVSSRYTDEPSLGIVENRSGDLVLVEFQEDCPGYGAEPFADGMVLEP